MTTRTLHCSAGNHSWQRPSQRGRLPKDCPAHVPSATRNETNGGTWGNPPRSVPVRVAEGTETGDAPMTLDDRMQALTDRLRMLSEKTDRKVIER